MGKPSHHLAESHLVPRQQFSSISAWMRFVFTERLRLGSVVPRRSVSIGWEDWQGKCWSCTSESAQGPNGPINAHYVFLGYVSAGAKKYGSSGCILTYKRKEMPPLSP